MKKIIVMLLCLVMLFTFAGCGESKSSGESLSVCIASEPQSIDPALNSAIDGATMLVHLFSGLAKWSKGEDGNLEITADVAEKLVEPKDNGDGTFTYTYTIREDAKWSDGEPVTAKDFEFAWKRATSVDLAADYAYMFEVVKGYNEDLAKSDIAVKALDNGKLQVTTIGKLPYWNELLAFPIYFPVREDVVDNDGKWATDPSTYVSNGPYTLQDWDHNSVITLAKSENYYDADAVTMPEIKFYLSDDTNNMLANYKNGDWQLIDQVPTNEIPTLAKDYPDEYVVEGQIGTYYVCWQVNQDLSPAGKTLTEEEQAEVRKAIGLLFDRNYIVESITQEGQVPASSFVAMGITEPDGDQFYENAGDSSDYTGYIDVSKDALKANHAEALKILEKYYTVKDGKVTDFPTLTYLYNTDDAHKAIAEYLQSALSNVGISMQLENQEWATFLDTRKNGDYDIARNGWVADYNDPICFLDMWTTVSGNNDAQFGREGHGEQAIYDLDLSGIKGYEDKSVKAGTWADTYDAIISYIKAESDMDVRNQLMHKAEDLLMSTGAICPLYFYTDAYMLKPEVKGFYSTPLGFKYFMYTTVE